MALLPAFAAAVRRVLASAVVAVLATACLPGPDGRDEGWWTPGPGEAADWDWQIDAPYELAAPRAMYDLDLFELAPAGSELRYPGGDVVKVPRGALAGTIGKLQARGTVVICYLDTGAYEHYRPDAARFPGHRPAVDAIPDDGAAPEDGSVIGWNTGWEGERWLDLREGRRDAFAEIIWARLDLAARMGCDGVEPDQNNPRGNRPGFPITRDDQVSWYREVAEQAHARGLSVGMKNGHDQPGAVAELVEHFDWALPEECAQYGECARLRPFVEAGKAVFAVDYAPGVDPRTGCRAHRAEDFDGLIKTAPPTGGYRKRCG